MPLIRRPGLGLALLLAGCAAPRPAAVPSADQLPALYPHIAPFPVLDSTGRLLELAFLGGFNNPRPQLVDIDGDGDLDLFVQEVTGRLLHFERVGDTAGLPRFRLASDRFGGLDIGEWYRFADLDADGDADLLAERVFSYLSYYRNDGTRAAARLVLAVDTLRDAAGTPIFSDRQNIPQLGDIDCNGLPDLLIGRVDGTVMRYEQVAGSSRLAPVFRLLADQFEGIRIIGNLGSLHGANTMALVDGDADGDLDLFWGDFFEAGLLWLENTGSCREPRLRSLPVRFPREDPVVTTGYNAPSFGDVDGDGRLDLVMGVLGGAFNPNLSSVANLYYLRQRADARWELLTRQLLPVLDVGSESIPAVTDWDGDGDLDILLANKLDPADTRTSRIYWLENRGTARVPSFRLRGALPFRGSFHYAPAFGDLDGDGRADLVLGQWGATVAWYRNGGAAGFTLADSITLTRGSNTTPALGDLDGDGDQDLVVGEASGMLNYYRNDGTPSAPRFTLVSDEWEGIRPGRRSAPALADLDGDGDLDLLVGSELNGVALYRNTGTRNGPRFQHEARFAPDVAALAAPALADLDGDGRPELLVGGAGGGLLYFSTLVESAKPIR